MAKSGSARIAELRDRDAARGIRQLNIRVPEVRRFELIKIASWSVNHPENVIEGIVIRGAGGKVRTINLIN